MSLLNALGASPMLSLIGWTVVSAFTLGAAAAALVLLCRSVAPRLTASWQHRVVLALYALSLAAAFAIAAVPRIPAPGAALSKPVFGLPVAGAVIPAPPGPSALTTNSSRVDLRVAVEEAVGVLAVLSLGFAALALARLCAGLWMVGRLRRNAVPTADADVLAMVDSLAGRMRIRRRIALRESAEVDTAMTGGWLQPFVLLPPGMAATLGSDIEPVLAHELAHVRRRDFAIAVLQAFVDAGTRLSPGHRWLSAEAGRLREQACDDVVVELGVEPLRYARALEALGQWSRGVQVTNVVCAANRHLADRVRRLLEGPRNPGPIAVAGAMVALCAGAFTTTLVAAVAPGLPVPPAVGHGRAVAPMLLSGVDAAASQRHSLRSRIDSYVDTESPAPYRITSMTLGGGETVAATVRNVYPKRIVALALGLEARRIPVLSPDDQYVMRTSPVEVVVDPGKSASASFTFAPITKTPIIRGSLEARYYPAYAKFEDGTEWSAAPPPLSPPRTIPLALVSPDAPVPSAVSDRIPTCFDADGGQTSEGGLKPIREHPNRWVQCTNGRWVELPAPLQTDGQYELVGPR